MINLPKRKVIFMMWLQYLAFFYVFFDRTVVNIKYIFTKKYERVPYWWSNVKNNLKYFTDWYKKCLQVSLVNDNLFILKEEFLNPVISGRQLLLLNLFLLIYSLNYYAVLRKKIPTEGQQFICDHWDLITEIC